MRTREPAGVALDTIAQPSHKSKIGAPNSDPMLGTPAFFAAGLVAGDLITRVIAAQEG